MHTRVSPRRLCRAKYLQRQSVLCDRARALSSPPVPWLREEHVYNGFLYLLLGRRLSLQTVELVRVRRHAVLLLRDVNVRNQCVELLRRVLVVVALAVNNRGAPWMSVWGGRAKLLL